MRVDVSWEEWKKMLGQAVNTAEYIGIPDDTINNLAYRFGNLFCAKFDPTNEEQRLLKELWEVGAEEERKALAKMLSKLADRDIGR
ncbi:MAG: DUF3243 domain-containing protein [Eubacteriales bacterium]